MPKIILTNEESEQYFHTALCNAVSSGHMTSYELHLNHDPKEYSAARKKLENPCIEDVWLQILKDGGKLTCEDMRGLEDPVSITLADVHARVANTPTSDLLDIMNGNDDAFTADKIIQTVFLNKIIYG